MILTQRNVRRSRCDIVDLLDVVAIAGGASSNPTFAAVVTPTTSGSLNPDSLLGRNG